MLVCLIPVSAGLMITLVMSTFLMQLENGSICKEINSTSSVINKWYLALFLKYWGKKLILSFMTILFIDKALVVLYSQVCHRQMWMEVIMRNLLIGSRQDTGRHDHNYPEKYFSQGIVTRQLLGNISENRLIAELICLLSYLYLQSGACSWLWVTWVGSRVTWINTSDQRLQSFTFILSC